MNTTHTPVSELSPEYALMGFLYFEPLHGYELHRRLETNLHEVWRIPQNQAYSILKRLEKKGLVQPGLASGDPTFRGRTQLSLTEAGRELFERWLYTPTPCSARAIRIEFLTRLFFAAQIGEDLTSRLILEQSQAVTTALSGLEKRLAAIPPEQTFNRLALELRIRQLNSLGLWLEACDPAFLA